MWLLWCCGSSTDDKLSKDELRIVVVSSVVVFVLVVSVVPVVWWCVVGWLVGVVVIRVVGPAGCLSLLLVKSLSTASHFELSSAVVSQVMSLAKSFHGAANMVGCFTGWV